jgi:anti-anti-sigma regulatory factor
MTSAREVGKLDISLAETLDISTVQNLHAELKASLDDGAPVSLNGSGVARIDTAALQALAAMFIYADEHQRKLELHSPSETLAHSAALLGIDQHVGIKIKSKPD